jgi:hypothetical protein
MPETSWQDALEMALTGAMAETIAALPRLTGALLLLVAGWFLSALVARATDRGLEALRLPDWLARCGIETAIARSGMRLEPRELLAGLVRWGTFLLAAAGAMDVMGISGLASTLTTLATYLPGAASAILLLILGLTLARAVEETVRESGIPGPPGLTTWLRRLILALVGLACLSQLRLVPPLLQVIVAILLATAGLGLAIAAGAALQESLASLIQGRTWLRNCQVGDVLSWQARDGEVSGGRIENLDPTTMRLRTPTGLLVVPYRALAGRPVEIRSTDASAHSTAGSAASASSSDGSDFLLSRSVTTDVARELESS